MKRSYIQMPLLIQGPRQPGNDIDVFLEPVIDELVEMFKKDVPDVWDEYKKEQGPVWPRAAHRIIVRSPRTFLFYFEGSRSR